MASEPSPIAPGAVVRLRSGGPMMVVAALDDYDPPGANCIWHDDHGSPYNLTFPLICLQVEQPARA